MAKKSEFDLNISDELNFWGARVFERIMKKFVDMDINRYPNPKEGYTGDLYRKLHWEVHSAAGGSKALVQFFYLKYGDYLQWGVGRQFGDPRWPDGQKKWDVPKAGGRNAGSIPHPQHPKYKSKPFMRREVTHHTKWLIKRLAEQYVYFGDLHIIKGLSEGMGDPSITERWIRENRYQLSEGLLNLMNIK